MDRSSAMSDGEQSTSSRGHLALPALFPRVSTSEESPVILSAKDARREALRAKRERRHLLVGSYVVLFIRYCIATFLSSFFGAVPPGSGFTGSVDGLIFAAYPLGMAITSVFAPQAIMRIGTRTAVYIGLVASVVFTLLFGFAPDLVPDWEPKPPDYESSAALETLFFVAYLLNGLFGAFAETACIILVSARFSESASSLSQPALCHCCAGSRRVICYSRGRRGVARKGRFHVSLARSVVRSIKVQGIT